MIVLKHDRNTDVAFIDVTEEAPTTRVRVIDVTDELGLRSQVLARIDENGVFLGLVIEDYSAFKREVMRKYIAFRIEKLLELIIGKVKASLPYVDSGQPRLAQCS